MILSYIKRKLIRFLPFVLLASLLFLIFSVNTSFAKLKNKLDQEEKKKNRELVIVNELYPEDEVNDEQEIEVGKKGNKKFSAGEFVIKYSGNPKKLKKVTGLKDLKFEVLGDNVYLITLNIRELLRG
jgi:hypothetical protein